MDFEDINSILKGDTSETLDPSIQVFKYLYFPGDLWGTLPDFSAFMDQRVETSSALIDGRIDALEQDTGVNFGDAFDRVEFDPALSGGAVLGYYSNPMLSTKHAEDRYGEGFSGLSPDLRHLPADLDHALIHEGVHGLTFEDEFVHEYRDRGFSMDETAFLKDSMQSDQYFREGATELAARKLNPDYEDTVRDCYSQNVADVERYMAQQDIGGDESDRLDERDVLDVEYDGESGYLREVGEFEHEGEKHIYFAELDGLDREYVGEAKMDEGVEEAVKNGETAYLWEDDGQSVYIKSGPEEEYMPELGSSDSYEDRENGFDNPGGSEPYEEPEAVSEV